MICLLEVNSILSEVVTFYFFLVNQAKKDVEAYYYMVTISSFFLNGILSCLSSEEGSNFFHKNIRKSPYSGYNPQLFLDRLICHT